MTRRNVLYLARTWGVGGAQTLIRLLLRYLPDAGFNIIVAPYNIEERAESEFLQRLRQHGIQVASEHIRWSGVSGASKTLRQIRALVARYDVDLIHTHDNLSNTLVAFDRSRLRCPCVASAYGWFEPKRHIRVPSVEGGFGRRHVMLLYYWLDLNFSLPRFDFVYTVSHDMKTKLLRGRTLEHKIRVIPTGLDPCSLSTPMSRGEARARLGLPDNAFVIGVVARLSGEKGHLVLIEALHRISRALPHAHLLFVGTGHMRRILTERSRELGMDKRIHLPGFVEDLAAALKAMDVCALPSLLDEGLPTALLEAQMAGIPVIGSDIGGTRETMLPGVTGLLTKPGDSADLAWQLERLGRDPALRDSMASAACTWVAQTFPIHGMIEGVRRMYMDALALGECN